uniref:Uncharacterized protein n=1 Tax=Panagrolaimus sp. JU765 TaxID=591449 RepID=A0AC34R3I4_9BILA
MNRSLIFCLVAFLAVSNGNVVKVNVKALNEALKNKKTDEVVKKEESSVALPAPSLSAEGKASYNFGVDFTTSVSVSSLQCIFNQGYKVAFVQIYSPSNGGSVNNAGCQSVI